METRPYNYSLHPASATAAVSAGEALTENPYIPVGHKQKLSMFHVEHTVR